MKPVRKHSLTSETERALRKAVLAGQFGEVLPGLRVLAKALGVSAPTVSAALKRLVEDGLVVPEGERRRMRVNPGVSGVEPSVARSRRVLWFATPGPVSDSSYGMLEVMTRLMEGFSAEGWEMRHRVMGYGHSEKRKSQWDSMLETERPEAMIAWVGRPSLAAWALDRGLRTLFLGGACDRWEVPILAVRTSGMVDQALGRLLAAGHRDVCLPLCNRPSALVEGVRAIFRARLGKAGLPFLPERHTPLSNYEGGGVIEAMVSRICRDAVPDAWIFMDWREYLAADCLFRDAGIQVPRDASVVLLSWDPAMDWHRPALAHFELPREKMARAAIEWILGEEDAISPRINRGFEAEWMQGESLAANRRIPEPQF